jgi:hypothetical protein
MTLSRSLRTFAMSLASSMCSHLSLSFLRDPRKRLKFQKFRKTPKNSRTFQNFRKTLKKFQIQKNSENFLLIFLTNILNSLPIKTVKGSFKISDLPLGSCAASLQAEMTAWHSRATTLPAPMTSLCSPLSGAVAATAMTWVATWKG